MQEAEAYKSQVVLMATGDASRFTQFESEYRRAPRAHATRLYLEAIEEILPGRQKLILDAKGGKRPTEPDRTLVSRGDNRTLHSIHRRDPGLQALHAAHPMIVMYDDHEVANSWDVAPVTMPSSPSSIACNKP